MTRTKKILSLLMALAMLTGLLAVFATTVSAYDDYVNVTCDPITVGTYTSIYPKDFDVGSAQIKSMKAVAGMLKISQAQYAELEAFSKFSSDMDRVTAMTLDRGRKNARLLVQPQYQPMPMGEQIAVLYCGTHSLLSEISLDDVPQFEQQFLSLMRSAHAEVLERLDRGEMSHDDEIAIEQAAADVCLHLSASGQ